MSRSRSFAFVAFIAVVWLTTPFLVGQDKKDAPKKKPKITIGKETTYVTGPVDKDGFIDYVAALNERLGESVKPEKNVMVLLLSALGPRPAGEEMPEKFFTLLKMPVPPAKGDYFVFLEQFRKERHPNEAAPTTRIWDELDAAATRAWQTKDFPDIAAWLKRNEKPLAVVAEAVKRPDYYYPLVPIKNKDSKIDGILSSNMAGVQRCRELASALCARAMLRTAEGRVDDAWKDLLTVHRLARQVGRGATLIESLIGMALDTLAANADLAHIDSGKCSAQQLKDRLRALDTLPEPHSLGDVVGLGERFMFLDSVMIVERTGGDLGLDPALMPRKNAIGTIAWDPALRTGNQWYSRMSTILRLKNRALREKHLHQIEVDVKTLKAEITSPKGIASAFLSGWTDDAVGKLIGDHLICLLTPALGKVQQAADRREQTERNLRLAFALAAYKSDEGRYPAKLDALTPKYLASVPDDLFTSKELIYRPTDAGYMLYSLGPNGKDDEGRTRDDDPRSDDITVRMPLPRIMRK